MAKTIADYLASERTSTQSEFYQWVLAETGIKFKTAAEEKAFDLGVRSGGLYSRWQIAKRETPVPKPEAKPAKRTSRKPAA